MALQDAKLVEENCKTSGLRKNRMFFLFPGFMTNELDAHYFFINWNNFGNLKAEDELYLKDRNQGSFLPGIEGKKRIHINLENKEAVMESRYFI